MLASVYGNQIWQLETSLHAPDGRGIGFIDAWQIFSQDDWCLFAPLIPRARDTWHLFDGLPVHSSEMLQTPGQAADSCSGAVPVGWRVYTGSKAQCVSGTFLWASLLAEFQHHTVVVQAECSLDWGRAFKQLWIWAWWVGGPGSVSEHCSVAYMSRLLWALGTKVLASWTTSGEWPTFVSPGLCSKGPIKSLSSSHCWFNLLCHLCHFAEGLELYWGPFR